MNICITSMGDNLDSNIDPRFGRCKYFLLIDTKSLNFKSISNDSMKAFGGAGIQAAQLVANTDAEIVITGNVGPNAFQTLKAAGIKVITGVDGKIKDVINKFNNGELEEKNAPTVGSHFGLGGRGGRNL